MADDMTDGRLQGIVAILRLPDAGLAVPVARALVDGGIQAVEIALTTPQAVAAITQVVDALGDQALIGAGSVVTRADAAATLIKIFPARELGGPSYIKALRARLPDLPLVPTGGIALEDVAAYRKAGAVGLGIGSPLLPSLSDPRPLARWHSPSPVDMDAITANAHRFMSAWMSSDDSSVML